MKDPAQATARDLMPARLVTLDPDTDLLAAMRTLIEEGISGAPVVDARGNLLGMLTQRDCLALAVQAVYHQQPAGRVSEYMSRPAETIAAGAPLAEVIEIFRSSRHRRFPVVDGTRLVGQLSRRDILSSLLGLW